MSKKTGDNKTKLAIEGGPKAFPKMTGKPEPKLGVEEFMALAVRFGFKPDALKRLRRAVSDKDLQGNGPTLARYYTAYPSPPCGEQFDALARRLFKVPFALGVSSGTAALHAAMVGVGAGPGTEVIVPGVGFLATGMAAVLAGATPVFCDIDASLQIDPTKIEPLITPRTVAIAPTHHWGTVCDMAPIMAIARKHKLKVVEDCAQSPGATYKGQSVGTFGDFGCFSISCYKIIGGGEGGLILARDERMFDRARQLAEAGGLWRKDRFAPPRYPGELFPGTNYRMSELEAAVDIVQLQKLGGIVQRHRAVSRRIKSQLRRFKDVALQQSNDPRGDIGYLLRFYPATCDLGAKLVAALRAEGIGAGMRGLSAGPDWHVFRHMFPLFPRFAKRCRPERCPVAADLYDRNLSIGLDQWYSPADCDAIAAGINRVFSAYSAEV
jgi:8-amino-3,8-dideoxy-alpha-D-manno-octulosonate transaminase